MALQLEPHHLEQILHDVHTLKADERQYVHKVMTELRYGGLDKHKAVERLRFLEKDGAGKLDKHKIASVQRAIMAAYQQPEADLDQGSRHKPPHEEPAAPKPPHNKFF